MRCEDFERRLQRCLDERSVPGADLQLQQHAQRCDGCGGQLETWQKIATVMPSAGPPVASDRSAQRRSRWRMAAAAAAVVLLAFVVRWNGGHLDHRVPSDPRADLGVQDSVAGVQDSVGGVQAGAASAGDRTVDPAGWWRKVQDRDWVAQTMPAVRSLSEGVAPLGRSLLRAVSILTVGGGDRPT